MHAAQLLIVVVPRSSLHSKVAGSSAEKVNVAAPSEVSPGPVSIVTFGGIVSVPPPPEAGKDTRSTNGLRPVPVLPAVIDIFFEPAGKLTSNRYATGAPLFVIAIADPLTDRVGEPPVCPPFARTCTSHTALHPCM